MTGDLIQDSESERLRDDVTPVTHWKQDRKPEDGRTEFRSIDDDRSDGKGRTMDSTNKARMNTQRCQTCDCQSVRMQAAEGKSRGRKEVDQASFCTKAKVNSKRVLKEIMAIGDRRRRTG